MKQALGMLELISIAGGVRTCDDTLKAASVTLLRASTVCPGKYMLLISGDIGSVHAALDAGEACAGHHLADRLELANVHPQLIPAINATTQVAPPSSAAIGVIEFYSISSAIVAADLAAKAANIELIEVKIGYAIGGKGVVVLTGEVGDVHSAVEAGCAAAKESGLFIHSVVIPRPDKRLFESLL